LTNTPSPPPGWYPDPSGAPGQRYFDGARWTEHRSFTPQKSHAGKTALWVTLAVVVLFFGGCATLIAIGANVIKHDAVTVTTPSVSAPATPTAAPAGSAVRDGKFEFQVLNNFSAKTVSDPTGNPYMTATAQGIFLVIVMKVTNVGGEPQSYFGQNQKLIDSSGREYAVSSKADMWMNTGISAMGEINPGNSIQVRVPFDVPPGTRASALELHDSMLSGGVSVRLG
jgi:hypothetical protein